MDIIVFLIGCLSIIFIFLPHMFLASLLLGGVGTLVGILIIIIRIKNGGPKGIPITGTVMCFVSFFIIFIIEILIPIYVHHVTPDFITFLFNW